MSVFTPVSTAEARALLQHYTLGEVERLEGIAQGVENTNYFLTTTTGEYVLTLFEHIPREDLPFYVGLMDHLAHRGIACPAPMRRDDGGMLAEVNGKPACIVTKLPGAPEPRPDAHLCRRAGEILARIHVAAVDYDASLENWRGRAWRESFAEKLRPKLARAQYDLIASENRYQGIHDDSVLPQGIIHGDYFHDNVLWDGEGAGGVIDFYFACDDALLYDVAIGVNDWCVNADATLDIERAHAFVHGYQAQRPLEPLERGLWPVMLRRAALRTWLGRLGYSYFPRDSHMTIPKDHEFSRRLLEHHVAHARALGETLS
ncbi:MAG: homoserine kinase [Usitatibacter sp.]